MKKITALLLVVLGIQIAFGQNYTQKDNVVLILIDDLNHLGVTAYGADRMTSQDGLFKNQKIATPKIDKLAEEGVLFNHAYAYPLCENTRIALMSGKHNSNNYLRCKSQHASDITFGDIFQQAGYATGIFGKWKQTRGTKEIGGKDYISEFGWDEICCFDVITEGQRFINPNLVINGTVTNYTGRTDLDPETGRRWYGPDICNRYALNFIDKHKDNPFFLYYPMLLVHDDHKPTPDTKPNSLFDNFDEANHNRDGHTGDDRTYLPDMIAYMDKLIGKVVDKLEEHGLRERTLIIVMGDNGTKECFTHVWPDGSEYPGRKGGPADNGIHVPLVISKPGTIKDGSNNNIRRYDGLTDLTDILPTICEYAGINVPRKDELDGISCWPQLLGKKEEHRQTSTYWYNANEPYTNHDKLLIFSFNKDFKLYAPTKEFPNGRFFDLRTDRLERVGDRFIERGWRLRLYSGLDITNLTPTQQNAYNNLSNVLEEKKYTPVESLEILHEDLLCEVGDQVILKHRVYPKNVTRTNIIWESSDPKVASINKFGELTAHEKGNVKLTIYSWDDAYPTSANEAITFSREGVKSSLEVRVK